MCAGFGPCEGYAFAVWGVAAPLGGGRVVAAFAPLGGAGWAVG